MELAHFEPIWYFEIMMILNVMKFFYEIFGYLLRFIWFFFYPKAVLAARSESLAESNRGTIWRDATARDSGSCNGVKPESFGTLAEGICRRVLSHISSSSRAERRYAVPTKETFSDH
jgi:hypothetical protein